MTRSPARIDDFIGLSVMALADEGDFAALKHDDAIAQDPMLAAVKGDDPAALDHGAAAAFVRLP